MQPMIRAIDNPQALAEFCANISNSPWLAVDTEFMRERTYYAKLCLIQISDGQHAAAIDPLALDDLSPLRALLLDTNIVKVFHAARQDQEIFFQLWQQLPAPVFDTQPAAATLGHGDQIGYAALVEAVLGIHLPKDHSRTDWGKRPLSEGQLRYALDDVIHLGDAYVKMRAQLEQQQKLSWLKDEFSLLSDPKTYSVDPMECWRKVRGNQHLKGERLAVLQQIAAWREREAMRMDLPKRWLLKDEIMIDLARFMPDSVDKMADIRGFEAKQISQFGSTLLETIKAGRGTHKDQWPSHGKKATASAGSQDAMLDYLSCALNLIATQQGTSAAAIASRKDLSALLNGEENPLSGGWKYELAGHALQDLIQGKKQIFNVDGKLKIEDS